MGLLFKMKRRCCKAIRADYMPGDAPGDYVKVRYAD